MNKIRVAFVLFLIAALQGCTLIDTYFLPAPEDTAQELYEAGQEALREKEFEEASEYFTKLKERYPFSPYTPQAELALGDAYFLDERYDQAEEAYKDFESLHPRDEKIPYVLYQIGMANFRQFRSIDLPQDNVGEAVNYFSRLIETYPDSEYLEQAKVALIKCRRFMAEHEIFVADFYWRTERYRSAYERYLFVVDNFQDLPEVVEYASERAKMSYIRYRKASSEEERVEREGSWKQWFDWL